MIWTLFLALLAHIAPTSAVADLPWAPVVDSIEVAAFWPQRSDFDVRFGNATTEYRVMAMFVLPGERVPVEVTGVTLPSDSASQFELRAAAGRALPEGRGRWTWVAPATPGLYPVDVRDARTGATTTLNVFVMLPYASMRGGLIDGYRVGAYPLPRRGHEAEYQRPRGFVRVTPSMLETRVSPHFTLGQFLCKQPGGYPKYVVLRQPLLTKLEHLLAAVNARGIEAHTFSIMSAYRTPHYNAAIGNVTTFSRHEYGDAADVFVDEDGDGILDDLNHDGRHTVADARLMGAIVHETADEPQFAGLIGGLGTYAPTSEHGSFVHVDVRGFPVRWGV